MLRIVGELGIPVAYGLRSGHVTAGNITLPIGVQAGVTVRDGKVSLNILEGASNRSGDRDRGATTNMIAEQTRSLDRHLRHGHGIARRNAEAARVSGLRIRRSGLSAHV